MRRGESTGPMVKRGGHLLQGDFSRLVRTLEPEYLPVSRQSTRNPLGHTCLSIVIDPIGAIRDRFNRSPVDGRIICLLS